MSDHTDLTPAGPASQQPAEAPAAEPAGTTPVGVTQDGGQPSAVEVAERPVVAVAVLAAHPGNVRRDLDLSAEFLASIRENGEQLSIPVDQDLLGGFRLVLLGGPVLGSFDELAVDEGRPGADERD